MTPPSISTLGELLESRYHYRSIKDEIRENLLSYLKKGENPFPGIYGYEDTVLKQLTLSLLSKHDILLLGLRGQGKTRLLRQLTSLLDPWRPVIKDAPIPEDPLQPITFQGRQIIESQGKETEIQWISSRDRFHEKLATPDVSMADLIGDIDPIKAVTLKAELGSIQSLHYGLIPRSNLCIFLINELPDLQPRIQVGLLNIMEERDIQIRGIPISMPIDIMMCFSANPEDYTSRGNIITPLKDRIESQIITHYPKNRSISRKISEQERRKIRDQEKFIIPEIILEIIEQIAFEARASEDYIDHSSGVSARLSIDALELLYSAVELRTMSYPNKTTNHHARLSDLYMVMPAITGKLELIYEGEKEGAQRIALAMIGKAIRTIFDEHFVAPDQKKSGPDYAGEHPYAKIIQWFESGELLELDSSLSDQYYSESVYKITGIKETLKKCLLSEELSHSNPHLVLCELLLEGLHLHGRLSKKIDQGGIIYQDVMAGIFNG